MHWFPFYSSDFIGATVGLSCLERGLLALMLPLYYEVGPFPSEKVRVYRIVGCESDEQKRAVDYLLDSFFVLRSDGWYQPRAEAEKANMAKLHDKAVERGRLSAESRAAKYGTAQPLGRKAFESVSKGSSKAFGNAPELTTTTTTSISTTKRRREKEKTSALGAPCDVDPQVWDDWRALRRAKKAAVTTTALEGIRKEANAAGMTLEAAMRMCCERGWAGFKAEWVNKQTVDKYTAQAERVIKLLDGEVFDAKQ